MMAAVEVMTCVCAKMNGMLMPSVMRPAVKKAAMSVKPFASASDKKSDRAFEHDLHSDEGTGASTKHMAGMIGSQLDHSAHDSCPCTIQHERKSDSKREGSTDSRVVWCS